jgi:hypothetical protein
MNVMELWILTNDSTGVCWVVQSSVNPCAKGLYCHWGPTETAAFVFQSLLYLKFEAAVESIWSRHTETLGPSSVHSVLIYRFCVFPMYVEGRLIFDFWKMSEVK